MSQHAVHPLVERWSEDPAFRLEIRRDPAGTVKRAGMPMTEDQWDALRAVDWSMPERQVLETLQRRFC